MKNVTKKNEVSVHVKLRFGDGFKNLTTYGYVISG